MSLIHYECLPEECLLTNLGFKDSLALHRKGSGEVCNTLEDGRNLTGWIDEDPDGSPGSYYRSMRKKAKPAKHGLIYCYDEKRNNKLIIVTPNKIEDWIIDVAHKAKLKMEDYKLSNNPDELHRIILFNIPNFQKLLHQLLKLKSPALLHAKALLEK